MANSAVSQNSISHHSALYSDVWESHPNAPNIELVSQIAWFLVEISLFECFLWRSRPKFLVKISVSLFADSTKMILTTLSSQYWLVYLVRTSKCFVPLVPLIFLDVKIAPILSTRTVIGRFTLIPKLSSSCNTQIISFVAPKREIHSASVLDIVTLRWAFVF